MKVFVFLLALITIFQTRSFASPEECNQALVKASTLTSLEISEEKDLIQKVFFEFPIIAPGPIFDGALEAAIRSNSFSVDQVEQISKMTMHGKKALASGAWTKVVSKFASYYLDLWPQPEKAPVRYEIYIEKNYASLGFANRDEFDTAARLVKSIDDKPQYTEAVVTFIARNLENYIKDLSARQTLVETENKLGFFSKHKLGSDHLQWTGLASLIFGGGASFAGWLNSIDGVGHFHLSVAIAGFTLPWIFESMRSLYTNKKLKKLSSTYKNMTPILAGGEALALEANPDIKPKALPAAPEIEELKEESINFTTLDAKEFEPEEVDLASLESLEHYGSKIQHGIHLVVIEIASYFKGSDLTEKKVQLNQLVESLSQNKNLIEFNRVLLPRLTSIDSQIKSQMGRSQKLLNHINVFEGLLQKHLQLLDTKIVSFPTNSKDPIYVALLEKKKELSQWQSILSQTIPTITSYQESLSRTRLTLSEVRRQMTVELTQVQSSAVPVKETQSFKLLQKAVAK